MAFKVLSKKCIYLNDVRIPLNGTEDNQSVDLLASAISDQKLMLTPSSPEESSLEKASILDALNDDCLRSIFNKLHLRNLWSVAYVCTKFNELAKENFKLKYKDQYIRFTELVLTPLVSLEQVKKFLNDFGSLIVKLRLAPYEFNLNELDDVLRLINEYCTNIKRLKVDARVNNEVLTEVRPLLSRLEYLYIFCDDKRSFIDLISSCTQLQHLRIGIENMDENISSEVVASKLTSLHIFRYTSFFEPFLKVNPQLKTVLMNNYYTDYMEIYPYSFMSDNFPKIESLSMHRHNIFYDDDSPTEQMLSLSKLKNLNFLSLTFSEGPVAPLMKKILENDIKLKVLKLRLGSFFYGAVKYISAMKSIEVLDIERCSELTRDTFITLVKRLPILAELNIKDRSVGLDDTPAIINEIIPLAKHLTKLQIEHHDFDIVIPKSIEKDCREILKIAKKSGDIPLKVVVSIIRIPSAVKQNEYKTIYFGNEWLNIELDVNA